MLNRSLFIGILIGVAGCWAFHKFIRPLPGGSAGG